MVMQLLCAQDIGTLPATILLSFFCTSTALLLQVPAPGGWQNGTMPEKVLKALDDLQRDQPQTDAEALRFPLSCSEVQQDTDKQGQPCSTIDCIVHSDILAAAQQHRPLKAFLIELALEWAGSKHKMQLNPKFKLPKMTYKGAEVRPQRVRIDKKPLVTDVTGDLDDEPSFPLMPSKPALKAAATADQSAAANGKHRGKVDTSKAAAAMAQKQQSTTAHTGSSERPDGSNVTAAASNNSGGWPYTVKCEGKPVTQMVVTVQLPQNSSCSAGDYKIEVCGRQLRVTLASAADNAAGPCLVQLPFATSSKEAKAELQACGQMVVTMPYLSLQQWVEQLTAEAPYAFTQLPIAHASYMELD